VGALKPLLVMREPVTMMSDGEAEAGAGAGVSGAETGGGAAFWASAGAASVRAIKAPPLASMVRHRRPRCE
jgi:hypothetical protein